MTRSKLEEVRGALRRLPVLEGDFPPFDPGGAPEHPAELFLTWLHEAIEADVSEPHAMTVSTVDSVGRPNSRALILKGLDDGRWQFAASHISVKGKELRASPWVALNFHWREQGRQVRLRGRAIESGRDAAARDFLARSPGSRASALIGKQSKPLRSADELEEAFEESRRMLEEQGNLVPEHWGLFGVAPDEVEFWQAGPDRRHTRLQYRFEDDAWHRFRIWP